MLVTREDVMAAGATMEHSGKPTIGDEGVPDGRSGARGAGRYLESSGRNPTRVMAAGLVIMALALLTLIAQPSQRSGEASAGTRQPAPAQASSRVAIGGPSDVAAQLATYAPRQSSGWHAHTGLHAIVVQAGTLTIVDGQCQRRTFGPGDSYVGGRETHLAINHTDSPVEMAVTYMFPAGVSHTEFHLPVPAPEACQAG